MSSTNIIRKEETVKDQDGNVVSSKDCLYSEDLNSMSILDTIKYMVAAGDYVESIDIVYDIDESIKEHRNSDKFKDKIDSILLNFNNPKSFSDSEELKPYLISLLKELKLYLNSLKELIEKCTFQKPVQTEGGTYTYEDDIKFNNRLAEIFGCNIKNFKVKVYVSNLDTYYKDREYKPKSMPIEPPKITKNVSKYKDKKKDKKEQEISAEERIKNLFNKYEDDIKNLK